MKVKRVWSKRDQEEGYKVYFGLGSGKKRRRVTLPTVGVFASSEQAREAYRKAKAEFTRDEFLFPADRQAATVQVIFDAWIERQKAKKCTPKHIRLAERTFNIFGQNVLPRDSNLDALTAAHLEQYFALRLEQKASAQTARKELKQINAAMNNAGRIKGLEAWVPPRKPEGLEPGDPEERRAITRMEERLILEYLKNRGWTDLEHMVVIGIHTGMRVGEIFRIDRADIRDEPLPGYPHGMLIARATKTAKFLLTGKTKNRPARMSLKVRKILDERRANWDPLAPTMPTTGPLFVMFNYVKQFKQCCEDLKIPYGEKTPNGITFHSTRHTFVTRQRERGTRMEVIQELTGQKTMSVTRAYSHVTAEEIGDAMAYLDDEEE